MFEEFIKERQYLQNVSPRTIEWYRESFKWLVEPSPNETQLKAFVIRMREKGLKPSSCNNRIRAVNAYLKWLESSLKVPKLKEEQRVLPTFSVQDIGKLAAWRPKRYCERRLLNIMLTLADTRPYRVRRYGTRGLPCREMGGNRTHCPTAPVLGEVTGMNDPIHPPPSLRNAPHLNT